MPLRMAGVRCSGERRPHGRWAVVMSSWAPERRRRSEPVATRSPARVWPPRAPRRGALVLPAGSPVPEVKKSAAIQAHRVERAAWRLDEVLPARSKYAAKVPSTSPTQQRGIEVGSVTKTRRYGAPPFLIATGVRQCAGAVVFTDLKAEKTLAYDNLPNTCGALRVVPALDYDGDGQREFAVFSDETVAAYRIVETPGNLSLTRIGNWSCKSAE